MRSCFTLTSISAFFQGGQMPNCPLCRQLWLSVVLRQCFSFMDVFNKRTCHKQIETVVPLL